MSWSIAMEQNTSASQELQELLKRNLLFHVLVENEVQQTPFGQLTFNIMIKEGVAQIETLNLVKSKRRKYNLTKDKDSDIP